MPPQQPSQNAFFFPWRIALILTIFVVGAWWVWSFFPEQFQLQSSTLRTSLSKLTSASVEITIPEKGKLHIAAGPTTYLPEARVFGMLIASEQAAAVSPAKPFTIEAPLITVLNATNPENPRQMMLAVIFPDKFFQNGKKPVASLSFATSQTGDFSIDALYFGSLPLNSFPPTQEYPIYLESSNIPFDENGFSRAAAVGGGTPTPKLPKPACSDKVDNDGDKKFDFPEDPGCTDGFDNDESEPPPKAAPLELEVPKSFLVSTQDLNGNIDTTVILPPAQEQLEFRFQLKATGGSGNYEFSIKGQKPNPAGEYSLSDSGMILKNTGILSGDKMQVKKGSYRYRFSLTDGKESKEFSVQVSVHDALGNAVPLLLQTSFTGTEHRCTTGQICEAYFKAENGLLPYQYSFSGESPSKTPLLQVHLGQAFYRFTPAQEQLGTYKMKVSVRDSRQLKKDEGAPIAAVEFVLLIEAPKAPPPPPPPVEIPSEFKGAAEEPLPPEPEEEVPSCEFLDVTVSDQRAPYFAFTCRNRVMEGSEGRMRPDDLLNRAEAAKITMLIESSLEEAESLFSPFKDQPESTPVSFGDVTVGDWYSPFVYSLFQKGILAKKTYFRPSDTLTVAEALKLIVEAYSASSSEVADELDSLFAKKEEWYKPYQSLALFVQSSLALADPSRPIKRHEIAEMLYKLWKTYPVKKFE